LYSYRRESRTHEPAVCSSLGLGATHMGIYTFHTEEGVDGGFQTIGGGEGKWVG
jgi:hypothetical protein